MKTVTPSWHGRWHAKDGLTQYLTAIVRMLTRSEVDSEIYSLRRMGTALRFPEAAALPHHLVKVWLNIYIDMFPSTLNKF